MMNVHKYSALNSYLTAPRLESRGWLLLSLADSLRELCDFNSYNPRKAAVRSRLSKEVGLLCVGGYFSGVQAIAREGEIPDYKREVGDLNRGAIAILSSDYKTVIQAKGKL
jgi:hypothetical protein